MNLKFEKFEKWMPHIRTYYIKTNNHVTVNVLSSVNLIYFFINRKGNTLYMHNQS